MNRKFGNGSKNEISTLHTPRQIPQISYITRNTSRESPKADDRYEQRADKAKEAAREEDEGSVEAQKAAREEVGEEEEGVPEDESPPHPGGAACLHPHRGGGQIEKTVSILKSQEV